MFSPDNIIMSKIRLDTLLVNRGLFENKSRAQASIMAGEVIINGSSVTKAGSLVQDDADVRLKERMLYVSRGGLKLKHALKEFQIDVTGRVCLDVGASTGGFTDCMLQHGASKVYALDVGYGQIDYKLRQDSRVAVMEKVNAHFPFDLPEKVDLATMDLSFISITMVLPNVLPHLRPPGNILALFKPQFEAARDEVGKGGVIKDPALHARLLGNFTIWMNENRLRLINQAASPILGAEGNKEFLIYMRKIAQ
jgi:23S rRNA (cytidine1920-2'-O)/16S rRNA (cytidine1409-2'-O)-methyltransferase